MRKSFVFVLSLLFLLPVLVNAQYTETNPIIKTIFVDLFGFPEDWLQPSTFIYYGIVPFLGVWLIIYGFLSTIRIFGRRTVLYVVLSFFIAFSTLPLRFFVWLVSALFAIMGFASVGVFVGLFFMGVGFLVYSRYKYGKAEIGEIKHLEDQIKALDTDINNLKADLARQTDPGARTRLETRIAQKLVQQKDLRQRMGEIARV